VGGVRGVHRSTDTGATWSRINDDAHEYGGPGNGQFVMGDMNTFGVAYMSTAGRGIAYGKPAAAAVAASCEYLVTSQWNGGLNATVRITNRTGVNVTTGWKVNMSYSDGSKISTFWDSTVTGTGPYVASNVSYNASIPAGQSVQYGVTVTNGGAAASTPSLTGTLCN
jgi:xyloglucan-specific exo-beta-1,4-glucanase